MAPHDHGCTRIDTDMNSSESRFPIASFRSLDSDPRCRGAAVNGTMMQPFQGCRPNPSHTQGSAPRATLGACAPIYLQP